MNDVRLYPLTPALIFGANAAIITILSRYFPKVSSQYRQATTYFNFALVAAVFFALARRIALRLTTPFFAAPTVFSSWGTGDGMTIRLDGMSLAFLLLPTLLLLALFWIRQVNNPAAMLWPAGAAAVVFVAANGLSFSLGLLLFDMAGALYWLKHNRLNLAVARLLLSVFTTMALMLAGLPAATAMSGAFLAAALWGRLALLPFIEVARLPQSELSAGDGMFWTAVSAAVGIFTAARFLTAPALPFIQWLTGGILLLNALLAWLHSPAKEGMRRKLLRLILLQPALALLMTPLSARAAITLTLGYSLALGALWITPRVGRPSLAERHWLWIYTAPILATLSLAGMPFTFGWVAFQALFQRLSTGPQPWPAIVILALGIGFSVLYQYWQGLLTGHDKTETTLLTALTLTIPFLLPGVAGIIFNIITGLTLSPAGASTMTGTLTYLLPVWLIAVGLGYARKTLLHQPDLDVAALETIFSLDWLWPHLRRSGDIAGRGVLRVKAIFEGTAYLAWAIFITLVSVVMVILQ